MVFESIVVDLINKYLGDYIVKLDKNQLSLGLFGGNVTLENLDIKENAFDEFDLPIKVLQGHIGKLTLKIPWKRIYSEPVIAELDGLYVLAVPNSEIKYDAEKERLYKLEAKEKELARIEENKTKRNEPKVDVKDSFGEKLAAQIIKNLQINISNIHIRYEDVSTSPQTPFSVGVTLANLSFQTCDKDGACMIIKDESIKEFFKSINMDSLAVYWDSRPKQFSSLNQSTLKATMKNTISSSKMRLTEISYLIQPISLNAMMHLHMKPESTQFTVPRLYLKLSMDQIGFKFTRHQYCDVVSFLDSVDRVWTKNRFRKYRPNVALKSNIKIWWLFPYTVILEEQVRRRRRMWSWQHIKAHRNLCHLYVDVLEKKLLDKKLTAADQQQIKNCEEELDLLNITLCRQQAEMKAKQAKKKLSQKQASGGGWFGGWFGKSNAGTASVNTETVDDLQKKVRNEFTAEEKAKLYEAIGYSEQMNDPDIPKEYVSLFLDVELHKLSFSLSDESLKEKKLLSLAIRSLSAKVQQRSAADAISVQLIISSLKVMGSKYEDGTIPTLASTQCDSDITNLLLVDFETNPLDQSANQKINVRAEPLELIYDSETINRIVTFFTPPEELQLYELSTQVMASIEEVKEMTATGLRHLADHRIYTDIKVDIKPSYFILPEGGKFKKDCKMLLFDLGSISILSERTNMIGSGDSSISMKDGKLNYEVIKETAYDKFHITLSTIQVLMIEQGEEWGKLRSQVSSQSHILKPFGFEFNLKKCAISNDANLPKLMIKGCLPHLGISLSDRLLKSVLELVLHIPFPQTEPPKEALTTEDVLKDISSHPFNMPSALNMTSNQVMRAVKAYPDSDTASFTSTIDNEDDEEFQDALDNLDDNRQSKSKKTRKSLNQNLIDLDAVFVINTMQLLVVEEYKKQGDTVDIREVVNLIINEVGTTVTLKRFDKNVQAYIGSLMLAVPQFTDPKTKLPICLAQTEEHIKGNNLLFVNLIVAEKTAPDFLTTYKNTRHSLKCEFKSLKVCLHEESIFVLLDFMNSLVPVLSQASDEKTDNWSAKIGDDEGAKEFAEKQRNALEDKKKGLPDTSVLGVITNRIDSTTVKKSVRLQAETEAERIELLRQTEGKKIYIPESNMTQWMVDATLEELRVTIGSESRGSIVDVSIQGMRADVKLSYYTTEIGVSITAMRIQDPNPDALYKKIIWIDRAESIFSMQVVIFNQGTSTPGNEFDLEKIDHMVNMNVGKIKIIFLYSFVVRIQSFFDSFQASLQVVLDKAQKYSEAAANRITNVLEEPPSTRTNLNIKVEAPVIYVPENSHSSNALMIDLGSLDFVNNFVLYPNSSIVLEESTITLNNLRVCRSILLETVVVHEKGILNPVNFNLHMTRNLSWNVNSKLPQIDVKAKLPSINVCMTQGDYSVLQLILQSNFGEVPPVASQIDQVDSNLKKEPAKEDKGAPTAAIVNVPSVEDVVTLRFAFRMEYLHIDFFMGESPPSDWQKEISPERFLTKMKCENLSLEGLMKMNTAMEVIVKLNNISLVDTREGSEKRINELIRNKSNETKDLISIKFVKDSNGNIKLVGRVAGILVCICVDYLMLLVDFFVKGQPAPTPPNDKAVIATKESDKSPRKSRQKPEIPIVEPRLTDLEVDIQIERPEIFLIEDIDNPNSNSIMMGMHLELKYSMLKDCDLINGEISEFHAIFCPFQEENRKNNVMDIISPTKLSIYCNKPINDGMQGSATMEHLIINITPAVIQSISKILSTLQTSSAEDNQSKEILGDESSGIDNADDFWEMRKFQESDFLFISKGLMEKEKVSKSDDTVDSAFDIVTTITESERRPDQKAENRNKISDEPVDNIYIRLPDIKVILESEVAKKCIPMLIVECSVDGKVKNPSTQLCLGATVCISISYFNDHINVWEPIIEVYPEEDNRQYSFELEYNTFDDHLLGDEDELDDLINIAPPAVSIILVSHDSLELTMSKTAIDVLTNLGKAFEDAYALHLEEHRSVVGAPYVIKNTCGKDIALYITDDFDLNRCKADKENKILVRKNEEVHLYDAHTEKTSITDEKQAVFIKLGFVDDNFRDDLSIDKSEVRGFSFGSTDNDDCAEFGLSEKDMKTLVVSTSAYLGMKNLDLRSILQVFNNTEEVLSLYYRPKNKPEDCNEYVLMEHVAAGKNYDVPIPIILQSSGHIYVKVKELNTNMSTTGASWILEKNTQTLENQILECKTNSEVVYYYSAALTTNVIPVGSSSQELVLRTYRLDIFVPLALHNQLPITISYQSQVFSHDIQPGCHKFVKTTNLTIYSKLKITFEHQNREWFGSLELGPKTDELSVINFKAKEGFNERIMDLGVHLLVKTGHAAVTIYSPYWMINKTGYTLTYKAGDDYQVEHEANNKDAILFSFLSTSIFNKKKETLSQSVEKAHLKINDSSWSDKFSLDTVGSSGKVICKKKPLNYEIGVKINLSSSGLTKIVTFLPYYMILNQSSINLFCNEIVDESCWIAVPPGEAVPFWPRSEVGKSMMIRCMVKDDNEDLITQPFPFYESHSMLMKLEKKYIGIFVEVQITEEANLINLQLYQDGMALVKLVNHLGDDVAIHYKQHGTSKELTLLPFHSVMYAWQDGTQKRELIWRVEGDKKKHHANSLVSDGIEDFYIHEMKAYWSSFVWNNERILLFTNDTHVAKTAGFSADLESIGQDIIISLFSIGLSLVNNSLKEELAYISVTNSGVKWNQIRKKYRQKPLKLAQSEALEEAFDEFSNKLKTGSIDSGEYIVNVEGLEVDLSKKKMLKPDKCDLVRVFEPGVYLQYRTSVHKMHIHLKIYKIQIDNQMTDCGFPVVFAPFPPPRSVALDTGLKPFIELSAVIIKSGETDSMRFKYFRILIQEMQLMLDQGFVNSLLDFVAASVPVYDEETMLKKDCQMIQDSLIDTSTIKAILQGGKIYAFDDFHISPIKVHLSFSLSSVSRSGKTALHSEVLNLFLQSVGIAITDMQDVIFKLGYFEKKNSMMPTNQIISAITSHYVSQALRQMYVLILGLDVLGNPFGVIRGMAQGVEDLFYEPVRGAILGPEEFVDGVAYGLKSLFGHAVGGAAGAVSRIVGTMGKGIAALTLDADYQRQRREQLAKRPENLGVGLAQGGKGILFGIVSGVTGVVTKPIDGAKKEGVEGFFKGVGKGLVGVVTRPVSGVVDFASSSFEGIRRVADTNIEVFRIRPPRYIANDGIIRPYGLRKAEGNNIWNKIKGKSNPLPNESYFFHVSCKSKKNIIFLTNERVFQLERNEILGIWSIHWQIAYSKLNGAPFLNESKSTIVFTLKEKQRKLFAKDNITKEIEASVEAINVVIKKVTKIQKAAEKQKQYSIKH